MQTPIRTPMNLMVNCYSFYSKKPQNPEASIIFTHSTLHHYQTMANRSNYSYLSNQINRKAKVLIKVPRILHSVPLSVNEEAGLKLSGGSLYSNRHNITYLNERQCLLIFVKVLFGYLKKVNADAVLTRAKIVITRRIREKELDVAAVQQDLRECAGLKHWQHASFCFHAYCSKSGIRLTRSTNGWMSA